MGQGRADWQQELCAMVALAVPVVLSELGWIAQGVVDTIMVGRLGPAAIGAVALGNAICCRPALFGLGLMLGLDTLVAQAYGRKDGLGLGIYRLWIGLTLALVVIALAVLARWQRDSARIVFTH